MNRADSGVTRRQFIGRAGAQVFGHYNPYGNFFFAYGMRKELVRWLDPMPAPYHGAVLDDIADE
jgi:hypothetical protein